MVITSKATLADGGRADIANTTTIIENPNARLNYILQSNHEKELRLVANYEL